MLTMRTDYSFHDRNLVNSLFVGVLQQPLFRYLFEHFFHPYTGEIITALNRGSLADIFNAEFQASLHSADPAAPDDFFTQTYKPATTTASSVGHFRKEIDVSVEGAYSNYNWELFFHIPLTIAVHLSKSQRFAEAQRWFHYIFDPTANDPATSAPARFWNFIAFRESNSTGRIDRQLELLSKPLGELTPAERVQRQRVLDGYQAILDHPFQPHAVARTRHLAYQYNVVMRYLDNLIAWGDQLFVQDTIESINEATQRYVLASNLLGPRPQRVPPRGKARAKTFDQIRGDLDEMKNALVELEGQFPFDLGSGTGARVGDEARPLFGIGRALYFCVPQNDRLLRYWDVVADRLFKIRHCMNIQGIVRPLALFDPPIDPGMLVRAAAAGLDVGTIVNGLNQPVGPLRGLPMIQKALELTSEVRALGNALLSAIEKADAEHLGLVRQRHEVRIQQLTQDLRFLQWKAAEQATQSLLTTRAAALDRHEYYGRLFGLPPDPNAPKSVALDRRTLTEENFDEVFATLVGNYDKPIGRQPFPALQIAGETSPAQQSGASGAGRLYLNRNEDAELNRHLPAARDLRTAASAIDVIASVLTLLPSLTVNAEFWGLGASMSVFDGAKLGSAIRISADLLRILSAVEQDQAGMASRTAGHERRADEWLQQYNAAAHDLMQNGRQILTSLISEQIAHREYLNTQQQLAHAEEVDQLLHDKFTNEELHLWMQGELSRLYYQYYRFAFDTARKAERTAKHELMRSELDDQVFVKFNYWDGGRKGLLAGDALHLDVKRLEMAYHDHNKRELEITRHVSLRQLDPAKLIDLRSKGACTFDIPEWLYDRDCPGQYMRRIKSVAVSIPAVAGPYAGVHGVLTLLKSSIRKSSIAGDGYLRQGAEDDRFVDYAGVGQSIATSSGSNDAGLFEANLRDDRFLPFEGAGAISSWKLDLPPKYRSFDYATISDVILHIRYTARQGVNAATVQSALQTLFAEAEQSKLGLLFTLRNEFPNEWAAFLGNGKLVVQLRRDHFPYIAQRQKITIVSLELFLLKPNDDFDRETVNVDTALSATEVGSEVTLTLDAGAVLKQDPAANVSLVISYVLGS